MNAVISIGTNDLYKTDTETFIKELEDTCKPFNRTILISTPPQTNQKINQDIINFNTRIKHHFKTKNRIDILNTHNFIKKQHLARDGVHLGWKAKRWLAIKISTLIQNEDNNTQTKEISTQEKCPKTNKTNEPIKKAQEKPWNEQFLRWQQQKNERWQQLAQVLSRKNTETQQHQNNNEKRDKDWPALQPKPMNITKTATNTSYDNMTNGIQTDSAYFFH
uniref:Uncharacterized protein n=1 Tax=Cacopsylla melanoneura TaxID=428564 RepID=A0A8D8USW5_9HEMI